MKKSLALGTLQFSGWYSDLPDAEIISLIRTFLKYGGMYIDTAPLYGFGKTDRLISRAVAGLDRKEYQLISKCGFVDLDNCTSVQEAKATHKDTSYAAIIRDCEASLERLKTDFIDIYLLHTRDGKTPLEESFVALDQLRKQKKVKYIGICNTTLDEIRYINKYYQIDFIQNRMSLMNRSISDAFASYLLEQHISVMPYRVIDYGLLTNKVSAKDHVSFASHDARRTKPDLQREKQELFIQWANENLLPLARSLNISLAQLSLAWALKQPYVSIPIVGVTKSDQIQENLHALNTELPGSVMKQLDGAYAMLEQKISQMYDQPVHTFRGLNERYY